MVRSNSSAVTMRMVISSIPKTEQEKAMFEEDLKKMDCYGLMEWL